MFVPDRPFQFKLMFARKAKAYLSGAPFKLWSNVPFLFTTFVDYTTNVQSSNWCNSNTTKAIEKSPVQNIDYLFIFQALLIRTFWLNEDIRSQTRRAENRQKCPFKHEVGELTRHFDQGLNLATTCLESQGFWVVRMSLSLPVGFKKMGVGIPLNEILLFG